MSLKAADGKPNWEKNLEEELGFKIGVWGLTGAPLVYGDLLILNAGDHGVAVDKKTGKVAWSSGEGQNGYATPVVFNQGGSELVAIFAAEGLHAVEPKTGKQLWFHKWKTKYEVNAADPIVLPGGRIFISSGYGTGCAMLKLTSGAPEELWTSKDMRNQLNPSIYIDGYLYGVDGDTSGKATLNCIDANTGELKWKLPDDRIRQPHLRHGQAHHLHREVRTDHRRPIARWLQARLPRPDPRRQMLDDPEPR